MDSKEYELLATIGYNHSLNKKDTERMNKVYQFLMQNFTGHIAPKKRFSTGRVRKIFLQRPLGPPESDF